MLCHERVGSWMVVNMWWYERGGSYPVTLMWGYEQGRFVCSVLTFERCCVRGGTWLVDHMCWTTGGQVRRVGLRVGRYVEAGPWTGRFVWASWILSPWLSMLCVVKVVKVNQELTVSELNRCIVLILYIICYFLIYKLTLSVCAWRWSCNSLHGSNWWYMWCC